MAYHAAVIGSGGAQEMAAARNSSQYERISQPVARFDRYLRRQLRSLGVGLGLIAVALLAGMFGYHHYVGLSWIDSYENAAMILSGKFFAGTYALFSGIAVLAIAGVIAAPLVHRFLHRLHADSEESK
jgi:hypothetical protein